MTSLVQLRRVDRRIAVPDSDEASSFQELALRRTKRQGEGLETRPVKHREFNELVGSLRVQGRRRRRCHGHGRARRRNISGRQRQE